MALAACTGSSAPTSRPQVAQSTAPTESKLLNAIQAKPSLGKTFEKFEVKQQGKDYRIGAFYRDMPTGHTQVARDGKIIAQAALDEIVATGRNPSSERMFLSVWLKRNERGVTNQDQVRMFGSVTYDASNDSLNYKPYK
jgi:hypothetical protein